MNNMTDNVLSILYLPESLAKIEGLNLKKGHLDIKYHLILTQINDGFKFLKRHSHLVMNSAKIA